MFLSSLAMAQGRLSVSAPTANAGDTVTVTYSDSSRGGQTITVTIDNGGYPTLTSVQVQITLDAHGEGTTTWVVMPWLVACFNAQGATQATMAIN